MRGGLLRATPAVLAGLLSLASLQALRDARAEQPLIREVEDLRATLPPNDPQRRVLNLRLGDLYFDEAGEMARHLDLTDAQKRQVQKYRERAAYCYQDALSGGNGLYTPVSGTLKTKVQFQLARLYSDVGRSAEAKPLWQILAVQSELIDMKREASLRLAEAFESEGQMADAAKFFQQAIDLCAGTDVCSYAHYRKSWMLRNAGKYTEAIAEIQLALWDSKGQIREEALRDLILFIPAEPPGSLEQTRKALSLIEGLSTKLSRPALLTDLSGSYFASGNRASGAFVLDFANARNPQLKHQMRLLEEYYGLRDWEKFHSVLERAESLAAKPEALATLDAESEKILQRVTVQLDGERISQPDRTVDFQAVVDLHLLLYPNDSSRTKMMEGWLAAEKDPARKQARIVEWLGNSAFHFSQAEKIQMHETRAAIAQKQDDQATVIAEMQALEGLTGADSAKSREYRYSRARALYSKKSYDEALPLFRELAEVTDFSKKWAVESQHLALDILGQRKDFSGVIAQAATWTESPRAAKAAAPIQKELSDMKQIAEQARFEKAVQLGSSPEALGIFKDYCLSKKLLPKSCDNAKVLAVKLKDESAILAILKETGAQGELAAEYEASGYFAQAAELLEKTTLAAHPDNKAFLRVALLREIAGDLRGRDRVLDLLYTQLKKQAPEGVEEDLVYQTLMDAGFGPKLLAIHWSDRHVKSLAESLESQGKGNAATKKTLLSSLESTGPAWGGLVLAELTKLDAAQKKISFYGKRGQAKFNARIAALKRLVAESERYLQGADSATRVKITALLAESHTGFADEILKSPFPEGLPEENARKIRESLQAMALPFQSKAEAYRKLGSEQAQQLASKNASATPGAEKPMGMKPEKIDVATELRAELDALHQRPADQVALTGIRDFYKNRGQDRVASYFEGRLLQTKKEHQPPSAACAGGGELCDTKEPTP